MIDDFCFLEISAALTRPLDGDSNRMVRIVGRLKIMPFVILLTTWLLPAFLAPAFRLLNPARYRDCPKTVAGVNYGYLYRAAIPTL